MVCSVGTCSVGVGDASSLNIAELSLISSPPHEEDVNWFTSPTFNQLSTITDRVVSQSCSAAVRKYE